MSLQVMKAIDEDTNIKLMQKSFFVPDFRHKSYDTLYVSCSCYESNQLWLPVVCDAPYVKDFIDKESLYVLISDCNRNL